VGAARKNFSDAVRAAAFARDRATCCYSGQCVWMADYRADPHAPIDWCEHYRPASRGGSADLENALTTVWNVNLLRGNSTRSPDILFRAGRPTAAAFGILRTVPPAIFAHLRRMEVVRPSDWFFNRALWHVTLGTHWLLNRERGYRYSRDTGYRARVALGMLTKWRREMEREGTDHPRVRGLAPTNPTRDQTLLWNAHAATDHAALKKVMHALLPCMRANVQLIERAEEIEDEVAARQLLSRIDATPRVSRVVRQRVRANVEGLLSLFERGAVSRPLARRK
jgi:hypothetical protein